MATATTTGASGATGPEDPESIEVTAARMARVGSCRSPSFAPDGRRLAFVSDLSGVPQVWTVATEGGWPTQVTALDDQVSSVAWSPDGAWLAFVLTPGGGMNAQIYLVRPDGTDLRRLSAGERDNNWLGGLSISAWTADGRALLVASSRRSPDSMDAYLVDVATASWRLVAQNPGVGQTLDVSRDGRYAILYRETNRSDSDLFLVDLAQGGETRLTPHEGPGTFDYGRFTPDGRMIYLLSNQDRDLIALGRIRLDDAGRPGPIEVLIARDEQQAQHGRDAQVLSRAGQQGLHGHQGDQADRGQDGGPQPRQQCDDDHGGPQAIQDAKIEHKNIGEAGRQAQGPGAILHQQLQRDQEGAAQQEVARDGAFAPTQAPARRGEQGHARPQEEEKAGGREVGHKAGEKGQRVGIAGQRQVPELAPRMHPRHKIRGLVQRHEDHDQPAQGVERQETRPAAGPGRLLRGGRFPRVDHDYPTLRYILHLAREEPRAWAS